MKTLKHDHRRIVAAANRRGLFRDLQIRVFA